MGLKYKKGISLLIIGLIIACSVEAKASSRTYKDVHTSYWGFEQIDMLAKRGILQDIFLGEYFKPQQPITRAEYIALIVNAAEIESNDDKVPFEDFAKVPDGLKEKIIAGYSNGLVKGIEKEGLRYINPNAPLTREEASTILGRMLGIEAPVKTVFKDESQIGLWAKEQVNYLAATGIIKGYEDQTFRPQKIMTRAEAVAIIKRVMESESIEYWQEQNVEVVSSYEQGIYMPTALAKDEEGNLYSIDEGGKSISSINEKNGQKIISIKDKKAEYVAIVAGEKGLYAVDTKNKIVNFISGDTIQTVIDANVGLLHPRGIDYDNGIIYIADTGNDRIVAYKNNKLEVIENKGLNKPYDVAVVAGVCYIADTGNGQIGKLEKGIYTVIARGLKMPTSIWVDKEKVYVIDQGTHRVYKIDEQNNREVVLGNGYTTVLNSPSDGLYDQGKVYIADTLNSRIVAYKVE